MAKYTLMKTEGRAKRAQFETVHGTIQTPVFMNVGTVGAIKGAVSTMDLKDIGTQVELSNTYHLHVRTGDKLIIRKYIIPKSTTSHTMVNPILIPLDASICKSSCILLFPGNVIPVRNSPESSAAIIASAL